jgi:hypothetical protein
MSDYNADPDPDLDRIRQVSLCYGFAKNRKLKVDQFSTLSSLKVYALVEKLGSTRLHVLVDPAVLPHFSP